MQSGLEISHQTAFSPKGTCSALWSDLMTDGRLDSPEGPSTPTQKGENVSAALAVGCSVPANGHNSMEFSLAWDMPTVTFGSRERVHARCVYIQYFLTCTGTFCLRMGECKHFLNHIEYAQTPYLFYQSTFSFYLYILWVRLLCKKLFF